MPKVRASRKFDRLIESWDPRMRAAFLESIKNMRDSVDLEELVRRLQARDIDGAVRAVGLNPVDFRPLDQTVAQSFESGGNQALKELQNVNRGAKVVQKAVVKFNVRNPQAERWLATHSSSKITDIMDDQRVMVRRHLVEGLERGDNPRTVARQLVGRVGASGARTGGVLGLSSTQAQYVANYREELLSGSVKALGRELRDKRFDRALLRAVELGEELEGSQIDKMVTAYANRLLINRAEGVARTEVMAALGEGQQQAMEQVMQGGVARENIIGVWRVTKDKRTRESHRVMDGQERALGEMFETGSGALLEFPGDPNGPIEEIVNCRCYREFKVDFFAGLR